MTTNSFSKLWFWVLSGLFTDLAAAWLGSAEFLFQIRKARSEKEPPVEVVEGAYGGVGV